MGSYVPGTKQEQQEMLCEAGYAGFEEMFSHIPDEVMLKEEVNIPSELSEQVVKGRMENIAGRNVVLCHIFRGAGAYNHYIPAIVSSATSKEEFATACTSYQAEISQGILQSISEYQAMLYEFTGMDASNTSMYGGTMAAAEAIAICKERKKTMAYISAAANPGIVEVMKTHCFDSDTKVVMVPEKDGVTDAAALEEMLEADPQSACFHVQQSNYYGNIEDGDALGRIVHEAGIRYITDCNPIVLAVMKASAEYEAGITVGDGQPPGTPLVFGGSYLGSMIATAVMTRRLPDRIIGETADNQGCGVFVLTLQAHEQHIRRKKTSSNTCSNQAWCALTVSVYMTAMEADGTARAAGQRMSKAHYLRDVLKEAEPEPKYDCEFFHELTTVSPEGKCTDSAHILRALESREILGELLLSDREIFWHATEMNTREEMDELVSAVREALHREYGQKGVCGS